MGLDMYLYASRNHYGSSWTSADEKTGYHQIMATIRALPGVTMPHIAEGASPSVDVKMQVMYWRKANHIHAFFVNEVQDGKDECQESYVTIDHLKDLRDRCATIMLAKCDKVALEQLPPVDGFFFGGTDLDEWYYEQTQDTLNFCQKIIEQEERGELKGWDFHYRSSW